MILVTNWRQISWLFFFLMLFFSFLFFRMIFVQEKRFQISLDQGHRQRNDNAAGHQIQESGLCVIENGHDHYSHNQTQSVGKETTFEVDCAVSFQTDVITQKQGNEDAGNDNVTQTEHGKMFSKHSADEEILREDELDGSFKRLGHGDHHIGGEYPENVVEK